MESLLLKEGMNYRIAAIITRVIQYELWRVGTITHCFPLLDRVGKRFFSSIFVSKRVDLTLILILQETVKLRGEDGQE